MPQLGGHPLVPRWMPPIDKTIAPPGDNVEHEILRLTRNVRIISLSAYMVWTVQPVAMEVLVHADGELLPFVATAPATATWYGARIREDAPLDNALDTINTFAPNRAFLLEPRQVRVTVRRVAGTASQLRCILKYQLW